MLIYTAKEAHSRIFVTGGSVFARQMLAKKKLFLARRAFTIILIAFASSSSSLNQLGEHRLHDTTPRTDA